jgi:hypothetical protein
MRWHGHAVRGAVTVDLWLTEIAAALRQAVFSGCFARNVSPEKSREVSGR